MFCEGPTTPPNPLSAALAVSCCPYKDKCTEVRNEVACLITPQYLTHFIKTKSTDVFFCHLMTSRRLQHSKHSCRSVLVITSGCDQLTCWCKKQMQNPSSSASCLKPKIMLFCAWTANWLIYFWTFPSFYQVSTEGMFHRQFHLIFACWPAYLCLAFLRTNFTVIFFGSKLLQWSFGQK